MKTRAAVITGGTRGLGRALVLAFASRGYRVYTTARSEAALRDLEGEAAAKGRDVIGVAGDVARVPDNARLARRIVDDRRTVDVLIHNAGVLGAARTPLAEYPPDEFRRVLEVNVFGPFDLTRQLLPRLAPGAAIEFVSSGASLGPRASWGAYNVSKIAVDGLAGIWAIELRERGIRVYMIDPGPMRTSMRAAAYPREDPATLDLPSARVTTFIRLAEEGTLEQSGTRVEATD